MKVGQTRTITVPPEEGYTMGGPPHLVGKTLIFEVKLVRLKKGG